jgi:superfamily II DNA/RNA helicase
MVCDSTYLIDRKTHLSPKLKELEGIVHELVIENRRKMIIFSEWTTMTFLIARQLSNSGIGFVELSGKVPVKKRQALIDEFTHNPDCRVFLSTDAGGTGLNLQAADCVVNFELPWNPARMNQRIGRANRIGQKSRCVNVINLITKNSIEEKICAGLQLKTDLFEGVFDGKTDKVEFSHEKRTEIINRLREMMVAEPLLPPREIRDQEEIPVDTPHYLNPEAFNREQTDLDVAAEEQIEALLEQNGADPLPGKNRDESRDNGDGDILTHQPPEKIEAVLNAGMQFLGGLMEMATGRKISAADRSGQMVRIDRATGEVTLKFKLPSL